MDYKSSVSKDEGSNSTPPPSPLRRRYRLSIVLLVLLSGHLYLSSTNRPYGRATSISDGSLEWFIERLPWSNTLGKLMAKEAEIHSELGKSQRQDAIGLEASNERVVGDKQRVQIPPIKGPGDPSILGLEGDEFPHPGHLTQIGLANATFLMLVKNEGVERVMETLVQIEDRFNHKYHYPYTFLSREPFTEEFKKRTANVVSSKVSYGVIPAEHWNQPDHIEEEKFSASREKMERNRAIYGDSVELLNENRFNSGFFFRHELTRRYRYSWRIVPGAKVFCDVEEDPFMYLQENNKIYGFTMSSYEFTWAVPNLWDTVNGFFQQYPHLFAFPHAMEFISDDHGRRYNRCHFWNSFDIADMNFWRSEAYTKYFEYMDASGGFYYERWRSGPVQSIAVSLLARKDQIHFFKEIGYQSGAFQRCPRGDLHQKGRCWCDQNDKGNFDYSPFSCLSQFEEMFQ